MEYSKGCGSAAASSTWETKIMPERQQPKAAPKPVPLCKQKSWSPDTHREEAWLKRKGNHRMRRGRSKSVTDDDLDELRACFELGFGFDSPYLDPKLTKTFPALELYCAVNRQYSSSLSRSFSMSTVCTDCDSCSTFDSPSSSSSFIDPGDEPEAVKMRLKQWAQVVACSVRQSSSPK